ncbi:MAG: GNAT family N-acetyltransferase [Roseobacter sp.]|nr:GNAT family N-acetyltransferase [Roseobacter sp.]
MQTAIRPVTPDTLPLLLHSLKSLAADLGDVFTASPEALRAALFGAAPACHALLALQGERCLGAALFAPVFSTVKGGAGAYVSDLWVAPEARGKALGTALLAAVAEQACTDWNARFLKLVSYADNDSALRFYARLGFAPLRGETGLTLSGAPFAALAHTPQKDPQ